MFTPTLDTIERLVDKMKMFGRKRKLNQQLEEEIEMKIS